MPRRFETGLAAAVFALAVTLAALPSRGENDTAPAPTPAAQEPAKLESAAPPRAHQIEPMVAPIKREAPKTLLPAKVQTPPKANVPKTAAKDAKTTTGSKETSTAKTAKQTNKRVDSKPREKLVGAKPNCDVGFKVDKSGKACVKIAASEPPKKKRR